MSSMNSAGSDYSHPLYTFSQDLDIKEGSQRYFAAASLNCPPTQILEKHFSALDGDTREPRYKPVRGEYLCFVVSGMLTTTPFIEAFLAKQ